MDLRGTPTGYRAAATKLYDREVGEIPDSDTGPRSERNFIMAIERRLRSECRNAGGGHRPEQAVIDWLHAD